MWTGHVASSSCILLEDHALSHSAYDAQEPEFLDLVGIGHDLRDDGLLPVLETRLYRKEKAAAVVRVNEEGELFNDDGNLTAVPKIRRRTTRTPIPQRAPHL